jgi:hypothetical protein
MDSNRAVIAMTTSSSIRIKVRRFIDLSLLLVKTNYNSIPQHSNPLTMNYTYVISSMQEIFGKGRECRI